MVKPSACSILTNSAFGLLGLAGLVAGAIGGCASAPTPAPLLERPMEFVLSTSPIEVRKLWTQQIAGIMTDLSVARDGSAILIATVPNPEAGAGPLETGRALTRYDRQGRKVWRIELKGVLKSLALTDDGKLALVSTYDGELLAIDARGKTVWKAEGLCKPVPLGRRFLCYHDDDAEPDVAFDVYAADGRKMLFYPITRDVLGLKTSDDQRNVVIALDGGQVVLFGPDFRSLWQRKLEGEVLDIAVSAGALPRIAVLYNTSSESGLAPQAIALFDNEGKKLGEAFSTIRATQIEAIPGGHGFATYGNTKQGQSVAYYALSEGDPAPVLAEKWRRGYPRAADYTSSLIATQDLVILGFEEATASARHSHLIAFDLEGALKWNIPLVTQDGAYLYAHGFAPKPSLLAVGTDDGYLSAFHLSDAKRAPVQAPGIAASQAPAKAEEADLAIEEGEEIPVPEADAKAEVDESLPPTVRIRPWVFEGVGISTSSSERRPVNRFALGVDLDAGPELEWIFGVLYEVFTSSETGPDVGEIQRSSTMFSAGWYFVPHRAYFKLLGGAQTLAGSTPEAEGASFTWTAGALLGTRFSMSEHLYLGLEAAFEVARAMSTAPMLAPGASSARFPAQTVFSLGLVFGVDFGRLR